ncbi:protein SET DOMAIN GROUP 41 isoform X2 [Mangifera indica]|uniref:protein SET DOMAIN GROUP 41 isoform X2 n=1 Tax=Mangifera indica TaxID=29780 RepID=UPI001CFBB38E|nr:protein SET DOMAIN GROUP 41 isoform X2 [Mangifera indica]
METEMEMKMVANEDIEEGEDITPPLSPLSYSLQNSSLFSADLRVALRLLSLLQSPPSTCSQPRLFGLLTNRDKLLSSEEPDVLLKIRDGAQEMAKARGNFSGDIVLEEAALCLVITNAVEVQDKSGRSSGIAVYDKEFSWINHSCSPNACYRFLLPETNYTASSQCQLKMRIVPRGKIGVCSSSELAQGCERNDGPRIIVRSIKPIKKGNEVTVGYTDLLQHKAMRQAELWSKYQFVCCCRRCTASPLTYVDRLLEEISVSNMESVSISSDDNFLMDEANQKLNDYMDEVISQYLLADNPESCCKKLENMLMQGLQVEQLESKAGKLQLNFRLHPLNYVSLNAYTTLASAYKIRSINLLSLCSDTDECHWEAFNMSKTSAAYSLLLASATDHLFQSESSLIASAANFWPGLSMSEISLQESKCRKCSLQVDSFILQAQSASLKNILNKLHDCISNLTGKVWSSLIHGCHFLQTIQDPTDFSSIDKSISDFSLHSNKTNDGSSSWMEESISKKKEHQYTNEERVNVSLLGVHCLFYGGYLANICYGEDSHLTCHIKNVLYDEEKSVH